MDFSTLVHGIFVSAIIGFIQLLKKLIIKNKKDNFWKLFVWISGFPMAAISMAAMWNMYADKSIIQIVGTWLLTGFLYSSAASTAYQQAKMTKDKITNGTAK